MEPVHKKATYDDLYNVPEGMTGEIIDGEIVASPRPARHHIFTASALSAKLITNYQFGEGGGQGGWIILVEPEIAFHADILVPDLAGWRQERFPAIEEHNWIAVRPDWICEVLSPSTARIDRIKKMRLYAQYQVPYIWLIDPLQMILEVYTLENGKLALSGVYGENDQVCAEPFQDVPIALANLWQDAWLKRFNN